MDRWNIAIVATGVLVFVAVAAVTQDASIIVGALVGIPATVVAVIEHRRKAPDSVATIPPAPAPDLAVEYRNIRMDDQAIVWRPQVSGTSKSVSCHLHVYVVNKGDGAAETVEVRFDTIGASEVFNESGNFPNDVDATVHPARFLGRDRILPPRREWCIAQLAWYVTAPRATATWQTFARNMEPKEGVVYVDVLDQPPEELR